MEETTGIVITSEEFEEKCELAFTFSFSEVLQDNFLCITTFNISENDIILPFTTKIGKFSILTFTGATKFFPDWAKNDWICNN